MILIYIKVIKINEIYFNAYIIIIKIFKKKKSINLHKYSQFFFILLFRIQ